ncbi:HAD-IIB family hydrolase [Peteryoungia desertarenae]|uniref:HAD-IIB family hydrolase n=1 Tax=Peteryoungia desertarenae TaxID=1813451 RepID=A0ABX6QNN1_9HYPH|nr:HAD-IIB family hydrolase [Peteryoungia desertarenae]QLF70191.1 HAD-IIB family hydrolase [Peteryoungia desertarenae]
MSLVFTDLDGTLLDHESYSFEPARPALDLLKERGVPVILASSKTEAEMRPLADEIGIDYPMIVENGAGIAWPQSGRSQASQTNQAYLKIRALLRDLPAELRPCFAGFGDWTLDQIQHKTGLSQDAAARAQLRRFSEPGLFSGSPQRREDFVAILDQHGLQAVQGGRFFTLMPKTSKAERMAELVAHFKARSGEPVKTVALGDAPNDLAMLEAADRGIIIANPSHPALPVTERERQGYILRSNIPGPSGWNQMMMHIVETGFI